MNKEAFVAMMDAYKSEKIVKSSVMTMVAKQLNDKEIMLMGDFFAKQKATQWSAKKWSENDK
jgi:cytochrome c553